ncbi:hypothetical protein ACFWC5_41045 [Streptomyces sp. NPDC060085]|uniref:hypothetical protein n=1 Tax=Streptomyces sp. NPDC060085 TaxID=3347054 RepID=UPI00364F35D0
MSNHSTPAPPVPEGPLDTAPRFGVPQAVATVSFPALGAVLHLSGMPMQDIFVLLGGCGALGAAAVAVASGRRLAAGLAAGALRAAAGK